jgi:acyl-CoA synthetase (AMP-forming)/AMP-acid ligase II
MSPRRPALLGALFVPLNHRLSASELVYVIQDAGCLVVVYGAESSALVEEVRARTRVRGWALPKNAAGKVVKSRLAAGAPGG